MKTEIIREVGYDEAVLGFSLSYNTNIERVKEILPKYAFGIPGESKFLEQIILWVDVTAPRFWWQEADTYRVGTSKQSESTMHTLKKRALSQEDFEYEIPLPMLNSFNEKLAEVKAMAGARESLAILKSLLPEGFLQRRIWTFSYKTLQNMYVQRINHKLPQWKQFLSEILNKIEHPEFIIRKEN